MNRRDFFTGAAAAVAGAVAAKLPKGNDPNGPPPRLDVRNGDDGWDIEVYQYGRKLGYCVAYDVEGQWAEVYRTDESGRPRAVRGPDHPETRLLRGGIEARWKPRRTSV